MKLLQHHHRLLRPALALLIAAVCLLQPACNNIGELKERASEGEIAAQFEYGRRLLTGQRGAKKDPILAQSWLLAAAKQGHSMAMAALGACHASGIGYPKRDLKAARYWYRQAARKGNVYALLALYRLDTPRTPSPNALDKLRREAVSGKTAAYRQLAAIHLGSAEPCPDVLTAIDSLRVGALEGNGEAAYLMAVFYARGRGVPRHDGIACGWLENAAKLGFSPARELMEARENGAPMPQL